jgi:hypothetical protein
MSANLRTYGFWFYDELRTKLGEGHGKIWLDTPNFGKFLVTANGLIWMLQSHGKLVEPLTEQEKFFGVKRKVKDSDEQRPHLNLWAVDANNKLIMMTQDHILPRSKGGNNGQHNLQTMCTHCNSAKGDKIPDGYEVSFRAVTEMDGRSLGSKRLSEIHVHALSVLDALERAS